MASLLCVTAGLTFCGSSTALASLTGGLFLQPIQTACGYVGCIERFIKGAASLRHFDIEIIPCCLQMTIVLDKRATQGLWEMMDALGPVVSYAALGVISALACMGLTALVGGIAGSALGPAGTVGGASAGAIVGALFSIGCSAVGAAETYRIDRALQQARVKHECLAMRVSYSEAGSALATLNPALLWAASTWGTAKSKCS